MNSIRLFGEYVIPHFRAKEGRYLRMDIQYK